MDAFDTQSSRKITLKLKMTDLPDEQLQLDQALDIDMLLDYDTICKKVLQVYRFIASGKHNIRLNINNFYGNTSSPQIPIYHPKNWTIIMADMLERGIYSIQVTVAKLGELRLKRKRLEEAQVQFDSDGSIQSAEDDIIKQAIKTNTPSCKPYKEIDTVRCYFCNLNNKHKDGTRAAGPFYGPFKNKTYAHLLCLLWCSNVYIQTETLAFCGIEEAMKDAKGLVCMYCKQKGSSFYCHAHNCKKKAHYRCAMKNEWYFDWTTYKAYCSEDNPYQIGRVGALESNTGSKTRTLTNRRANPECKMQIEHSINPSENIPQ